MKRMALERTRTRARGGTKVNFTLATSLCALGHGLGPLSCGKINFEFSITAASLIHEMLMLPGIRKRAGAIARVVCCACLSDCQKETDTLVACALA